MSMVPIDQVVDAPKQGKGGLIGSILGNVASIGSMALGPVGKAVGGAIGTAAPMIGNAIDPNKPGSVNATVPEIQTPDAGDASSPLSRLMVHPDVQMAQMQNSKEMLQQSNIPNAENYIDTINQAMSQMKTRATYGSNIG